MAAITNIEWLNMNALRTYPIHEDSDIVPCVGEGARAVGVSLPTCLIVDFAVTVAQEDLTRDIRIGLTGLVHAGGAFAFEISANWPEDGVVRSSPVARLAVDVTGHTQGASYRFSGTGDFEDCVGWLTVGDAARAAEELPEGAYTFAPGQCDFEASTVRVAPRGVRSLSVVDRFGGTGYRRLYGTVRLVGGTDVTLRSDAENNAIWIKAQSNTGYEGTQPCSCGAATDENEVEHLFTEDTIASVNGMTVRNVQIVGDQCISVSGDVASQEIGITNGCGTPCCGCTELAYIDAALSTLNKSVSSLEMYASKLDSRVDELRTVVTADRNAVRAMPGAMV